MFLWAICHPDQFPIYSIPTTYWFPVSIPSFISQSVKCYLHSWSSFDHLFPDWLYLLGFPSLFFFKFVCSWQLLPWYSSLISSHNCFILVVLHHPHFTLLWGQKGRNWDHRIVFFLVSSAPLVHSIALSPHGIRIQHKVAWEKLAVKLGFVSFKHSWRLKSSVSLTYSMARPGQIFQMKNDSLAQSTRTFQRSAITTCLVYHMHVFFPSHLHRNSEMFLAKSFSKIHQEAAKKTVDQTEV